MSESERSFDPTILQRFQSEIADWRPEQAVAALRVVRAIIAGDGMAESMLDPETGALGELTNAHVERVHIVVRQIVGDWTH